MAGPQPPRLYRIPFRVALVILIAALAMTSGGLWLSGPGGQMDGFALVFSGFFLIIVAIVIAAVYWSQEKQFRQAVRNPLLDFQLDDAAHARAIIRNAAEIKSQNKLTLLIMLFFCGLIAVVSLLFGEEGRLMSLIAVGIAVFLSLAAWIVTAWRVAKLQRSQQRCLLSLNGALVSGDFHNWSSLGSRLEAIELQAGDLQISYSTIGRYSRQHQTIHLVIPAALQTAAAGAVEQLRQHHHLA